MRRTTLALLLPLATVVGACGAAGPEPRTVQPGAPGEATREVDPAEAPARATSHTAADVDFMRAMIPHHAQALVMTALVPERTDRPSIRLLAERIEATQRSEITQMRRWLQRRGEPVPDPEEVAAEARGHGGHGAHHAGAHRGAHGMATTAELAQLETARGTAFDRLFLELMIRHHEGALIMTRELLATEGAGQEPELFQILSHIDADQRAEIARMRRMLNELQ